MNFSQALTKGRLIRRYKRFLADVELADGSILTAHTSNTGSMLGCAEPGSRVWMSRSDNPRRKYPWSWELVETSTGAIVGINTALPPVLVQEGIDDAVITELQGYQHIRREVRYGSENSRIDLLLQRGVDPDCYVEVKNVTAIIENNIAVFPDAVSARGQKHLRELMQMVQQGKRAVIFFAVPRTDARAVRPADHIDPLYGELLRRALAVGVEAIAYSATVSAQEIKLVKRLPVHT
jgi:sugar fermentation stimulation protein A